MSSQTIKVIWINIISLPTRLRSSIVAIVGSAGVVAVLVTVLAMAQGFEDALKAPNQSNLFVILKGGATTELVSNITSRSALKLRQHSGIEKANTVSQFSSQLLVAISVPMIGKDADANVSLRGVDQSAYKLHQIHLLKGTLPTTGKREVIVGQRAAEQFEGLQVGSLIGSGTNSWKVVGIFDSQGSIHETEIIADVTMVQNAFQRGNTYSSVHGKLSVSAGASIEQIQTLVENDPELDLVLFKADDYYANQSKSLSVFIKSIGYSTAFIMAIGAIFASLNTMYGSVSSRKREFGILRALGYSKLSIAISVFFESALLSLLGGLLGCVVVYLILNNYAVSTFNMLSFSQVAFSFSVTKETMFEGLKWALIIGSLGGMLTRITGLQVDGCRNNAKASLINMDICMDSYRGFHQHLKQELQAVSSEEKAASMRRYFPNGLVCIGAISEDINQISAVFIREHDAMLPEEYLSLAEYILERAEFHEEILISYRLIEKLVKKHFDDNLLVRFQYWLENYANNWALVDDLCIKAIYNYLYARPHLIERTQLWARSEVSWCRRASNVVWVKFIYRKMGKQVFRLNPELVFANCDLHIRDPDEFVQKSVGWLLKVTAPHHHDAVVNYIKTNIASMQKSTVRYALEKVPKETRDEIMRL